MQVVEVEVVPRKIGQGWEMGGVETREVIVTCPLKDGRVPVGVGVVRENYLPPSSCMPVEVCYFFYENLHFLVIYLNYSCSSHSCINVKH